MDFPYFLLSFACQFFVEEEAIRKLEEICEKPSPDLFASLPSYLTFSWITNFIWTGFRRPLTTRRLFNILFLCFLSYILDICSFIGNLLNENIQRLSFKLN